MSTDPAATLHALADKFRLWRTGDDVFWTALAEHVEGAAQRIEQRQAFWDIPAPLNLEARELLAVAAAAGVTP